MRDDMSPEEKEITSRWLDNLWGQYTSIVETQRKLAPGAVNDYVNNFSERLQSQGGDTAQAGAAGGPGGQVARPQSRATTTSSTWWAPAMMTACTRRWNSSAMWRTSGRCHLGVRKGDRVAVITAEGNIMPGEQPPGSIGGDSLAQLIRGAVEADGVKAIVLRVNSGGGSMFASEIIRQQVLHARDMGLPVVVSMGAVAASGGYYIAAEADEIWATPSTITGSIGVFAAFPTFEELLQRVGISHGRRRHHRPGRFAAPRSAAEPGAGGLR